MRIILIRKLRVIAFLALVASRGATAQMTDSLSAARRVVAAASLAAMEYALGVAPAGRSVTLLEEVDEARLFIDQARHDVPLLPVAVRGTADSLFNRIAAGLAALAPPAEVRHDADALIAAVTAATGGAIAPQANRPGSLARGAKLYARECTACHGPTGKGDGPKAKKVKGPPPTDLTDTAIVGGLATVDIYRKLLIGVAGTAMPGFEESLSEDDRWAVAAYVATLPYGSTDGAIFAAVRRQVDTAVARRATALAFDAYLTFEQVETSLRTKDPALARALETRFTALRDEAATADASRLSALRDTLFAGLTTAERVLAERSSSAELFATSFLLLLREGFEAILIVGALLAFLAKAGAPERRRDVLRGVFAALGASALTWVAVEVLFEITPAQREALEGITMLIATFVLFWVSYWLLSKIEVQRWNAYVKDRLRSALASGSGIALASVSFLAVYREGLETILFYKALFLSAGAPGTTPVLGGIAVGGVGLVAMYLAIHAFGMRMPTKPFFAITSAVLYYMAFVFAGKGIAELQAGGVVGISPVSWAPRLPTFGIYPTVETLALQGVLVALAIVAIVWTQRSPASALSAPRAPQDRLGQAGSTSGAARHPR